MSSIKPIKCAIATRTVVSIEGMSQLLYGQLIDLASIRHLHAEGSLTLVNDRAVNFAYGSLYAVGLRQEKSGEMQARYWLRLAHIPVSVGEEYTGNSYVYMFLGYLEQVAPGKFEPACAPIGEYGKYCRRNATEDVEPIDVQIENPVADAVEQAKNEIEEHVASLVDNALKDIEQAVSQGKRAVTRAQKGIEELLEQGMNEIDEHFRDKLEELHGAAPGPEVFTEDLSAAEKELIDLEKMADAYHSQYRPFRPLAFSEKYGGLLREHKLAYLVRYNKRGEICSEGPVLVKFGNIENANEFFEVCCENGYLVGKQKIVMNNQRLESPDVFTEEDCLNRVTSHPGSEGTDVVRPCTPRDLRWK